MTKSTITRERIQRIIRAIDSEAYDEEEIREWLSSDEIMELARMALSAMDSEPVALKPELAKVIYHFRDWNEGFPVERFKADYVISWMLANYPPAQPAPVVPENCVTAEHRRVIEMLLNVCGAAFELADDSCQQDIDGEDCHVVPDDAFQNLSDALDEIENTLPTEDIDRPDVFLAWSAMPRAALKSLLQAQPVPVVDADDNFYSWFGREWAENYQHNQYTTAAKQMLGVMAESAWKAGRRAAMLQENPVCTCPSGDGSLRWPCPVHPGNSPVIPDGYVMVPMRLTTENGAKGALSGEFSETKFVNCPECFGDDECETCDGSGRIEITVPVTWTTIKDIWAKGVEHFAAAPQEVGDA